MATDFELQVLAELGEIKSTAAATAATCTALEARLFNQGSGVVTTIQGDIQEIKAARIEEAKDAKRDNIIHYVLGPAMVVIHAVLHHFGIKV